MYSLSRIIYLIFVFIFNSDNARTGTDDISPVQPRLSYGDRLTELLVHNDSGAGVLSGLTATAYFSNRKLLLACN